MDVNRRGERARRISGLTAGHDLTTGRFARTNAGGTTYADGDITAFVI
jgi:hypothetical protein